MRSSIASDRDEIVMRSPGSSSSHRISFVHLVATTISSSFDRRSRTACRASHQIVDESMSRSSTCLHLARSSHLVVRSTTSFDHVPRFLIAPTVRSSPRSFTFVPRRSFVRARSRSFIVRAFVRSPLDHSWIDHDRSTCKSFCKPVVLPFISSFCLDRSTFVHVDRYK